MHISSAVVHHLVRGCFATRWLSSDHILLTADTLDALDTPEAAEAARALRTLAPAFAPPSYETEPLWP